jgi:hypothetical protein
MPLVVSSSSGMHAIKLAGAEAHVFNRIHALLFTSPPVSDSVTLIPPPSTHFPLPCRAFQLSTLFHLSPSMSSPFLLWSLLLSVVLAPSESGYDCSAPGGSNPRQESRIQM